MLTGGLVATAGDTRAYLVTLQGGLSGWRVMHASGSMMEVYAHGATVTSYKDAVGREYLMTSAASVFDGVKPIRGGIPLIFPKFGAGWSGPSSPSDLPSHGFARRSMWKISVAATANGDRIAFTLDESAISREHAAAWPHAFLLTYIVSLGPQGFATEMVVRNPATAAEPFHFQTLLHTYYNIGAIESASVTGLHGAAYIDQLQAGAVMTDGNASITFAAETDAIYTSALGLTTASGGDVAPSAHTVNALSIAGLALEGPADAESTVELRTLCSIDGVARPNDVVVWNPWSAKAQRMADFGDDEFHTMLCVEPGAVDGPTTLAPGGEFRLKQIVEWTSGTASCAAPAAPAK